MLFGLFAAMAASGGSEGAGAVSVACLGAGGGLLFWGQMLRYFSILEEKMAFMIAGYLDEEMFEEEDDAVAA